MTSQMSVALLLHVVLISFVAIISLTNSQSFGMFHVQLPHMIHSHAVGIHNNTLTILNGIHQDTNPVSTSYSVHLLPPSSPWKRHHFELPLRATAILVEGDSSVQIDHLLYIFNPNIIGNEAIRYNILLVYDLLLQQYVEYESSLFKTAFSCTAYNANNNLIYIIGGIDIDARFPIAAMAHTQTYSIPTNTWNRVSDINIARGYAGCAMDATHDNIFLFGGTKSVDDLRNSVSLRTIEQYSVATDEWIVLKQKMKVAKGNIKCILLPINGKIYCSTATNQDDDQLTKWEVFDPMDFSIDIIHINMPRILFSLSLWGDACLIAAGGAQISKGVMRYYDSTEYLGECPAFKTTSSAIPTVEPTNNIKPTSNPTINPTIATNKAIVHPISTKLKTTDISQCYIGNECKKGKHCCPHGSNRKAIGVKCVKNRWSKNKRCCIEAGFAGCTENRHCCVEGGRTFCVDNVCTEFKIGGSAADAMIIIEEHETQSNADNDYYSILIQHMWLLPTLCMMAVILLIIVWCSVLKEDYNELETQLQENNEEIV